MRRPLGLFILAAAVFFALSPNLASSADEIKSLRVTRTVAASADFTDMQCMSCHQMKQGFSHPINLGLKSGMSPSLPLTSGRIVCTTCHEPGVEAHRAARASGDGLLRVDNTLALCSECHDSSDHTRVSQHALALGRAHLTNSARSKEGGLVRETQNCLTCHDGLISEDVAMTASTPGDAMGEHPVNVTYRSRLETAAEVRVKPASSLNPSIRLFDGKVGCGSCHSPYSTQESLLVMSNHRSALCFGCHNQ